MRIPSMRPQTGVTTGSAALRDAGAQASESSMRPRVTEDVYSGAQDSESLWMASAWRGQGSSGSDEQLPASAGAPVKQSPETSTPTPTLTAETSTHAMHRVETRISFWA